MTKFAKKIILSPKFVKNVNFVIFNIYRITGLHESLHFVDTLTLVCAYIKY